MKNKKIKNFFFLTTAINNCDLFSNSNYAATHFIIFTKIKMH